MMAIWCLSVGRKWQGWNIRKMILARLIEKITAVREYHIGIYTYVTVALFFSANGPLASQVLNSAACAFLQ